jgi:hypothetical protein
MDEFMSLILVLLRAGLPEAAVTDRSAGVKGLP